MVLMIHSMASTIKIKIKGFNLNFISIVNVLTLYI